ncbi:Pentatricopeptide repeat-containing protein [Thalictrum thalictroides]|uniref:Pentatricopeptide repeat-containing protein n=1 Tax=Thalictrum thalictroides TaxID=46969 RepID=A0A7J6X0S4_THATH|nr:Pentatricopeptide repeat-containing protein [Thalictrum thalictroides]
MLDGEYFPDSYTIPIVIRACSQLHALQLGESVHGQVMKFGFDTNMIVMSGFVRFYASCGSVEFARKLFDDMPERDVVSWTTMISGYVQLNCLEESFVLFDEMRRDGIEPNKVTIVSLLAVCGNVQALDGGKWVHSYIVDNKMEFDIVVGNALINMYARCGCMSNALEAFHNILEPDTVSWNTLISGFAQNGCPVEALRLFQEMKNSNARPNEITLTSTLSACAQLGDLEQGKILHTYIAENNIIYSTFIGNGLINMYSKCGELKEAECVFHQMPDKDIFSWTALVSGYVQGSKLKEALSLFHEMQLSGVEPNEVTLVSMLSACAQLGALDQGKLIHEYIIQHRVKQDVYLESGLIDMYVKCGCMPRALQIFHCMRRKYTFSWNALIGGLAMHGHGREAIILFSQMQMTGAIPDSVTFLAVLCACTHSGLVSEGYQFFNSMSSFYGITPGIEHYGCMVDLLGRAGHLEEAAEFIEKMPIEPNHIIWGTLLSACCVHRKVELGEKVAQHIIRLAPDDEVYVLISNLYAEAGRWDDVRRVRALMGNKGLEKSPGCSLIEVDGIVEEFHVRGMMHYESDRIYLALDCLMLQSKEALFESSEYEASMDNKNGEEFFR